MKLKTDHTVIIQMVLAADYTYKIGDKKLFLNWKRDLPER